MDPCIHSNIAFKVIINNSGNKRELLLLMTTTTTHITDASLIKDIKPCRLYHVPNEVLLLTSAKSPNWPLLPHTAFSLVFHPWSTCRGRMATIWLYIHHTHIHMCFELIFFLVQRGFMLCTPWQGGLYGGRRGVDCNNGTHEVGRWMTACLRESVWVIWLFPLIRSLSHIVSFA